jgi:hypothetical protein
LGGVGLLTCLCLGCLAFVPVFGFICSVSLLFNIPGLIMSIIARKQPGGKTTGLTGLIMNAVGCGIAVILLIIATFMTIVLVGSTSSYSYYY